MKFKYKDKVRVTNTEFRERFKSSEGHVIDFIDYGEHLPAHYRIQFFDSYILPQWLSEDELELVTDSGGATVCQL